LASPWFYINQAKEKQRTAELEEMKRRVIEALPQLCPKCKKLIEEVLKVNDKPQ